MTLLGLIAEDQSDIDVAGELARKLARKRFAIKRFVAHGCGRLHAKCRPWAEQLRRQGCSLLIVISDLDRERLPELSASLRAALSPSPIKSHVVVIAVREIEAWLLADHDAITRALRLPRPVKKQSNPEAIQNPKEHLRDLVRERSKGRLAYLNTVHNQKIAQQVQPVRLERCPSFRGFEKFVREQLR